MIVAHSENTLHAPAGPLAGTHKATSSLLIVKNDNDWQIAASHNSLQLS